jgi:hypothetical protein
VDAEIDQPGRKHSPRRRRDQQKYEQENRLRFCHVHFLLLPERTME